MNPENSSDMLIPDLLEREAGLGWHEAGLDEDLLELLRDREYLIHTMATGEDEPDSFAKLDYIEALIRAHKTKHNISDPPPRTDTSGATD